MPDLEHPNHVVLKTSKCPDCREKIEVANLKKMEQMVKASCRNDKCGYSVDLFWLPMPETSLN